MNDRERAIKIADATPDGELRERFVGLLIDHEAVHRTLRELSDLNAEQRAKLDNQYMKEVAERETRKAEGRAHAAEQAAEDLSLLLPLLQDIPFEALARIVHLANRHTKGSP